MAMGPVTACRSCGAPVRFVPMAGTGRLNPLDAEPTANGNVVVGVDGVGRYVARHAAELPPDVPRYVSHFSSCPDRDAWRKR